MGTAREQLMALLEEALFFTRKSFGMFGQIQITIHGLTPERLEVRIWTRHELDGASVALNVRNAVLNFLQDLLPVQRFVATYENPTLGISGEVHDLPYAEDLPQAGELPSSVILIPQNADPAREALRPRFREAWDRFIAEQAG